LGSLRELTARATERPLDLYSKYEFHFTLLSSLLSAELTAQGAKRPRRPLHRVRVPPHAPEDSRASPRASRGAAAQTDQVAAPPPTCAQLEDCLRRSTTSPQKGTLARPVAGAGVSSRTSTSGTTGLCSLIEFTDKQLTLTRPEASSDSGDHPSLPGRLSAGRSSL